jgi:fused signal recognition particle receptor
VAFFKKLKERMFKSSSKIDEGLEAIVSDGGAEEAAESAELIAQQAEAEAAAAREAEAALLAAEQAEAARLAQEAETARLAHEAETARLAREAEEAAAKSRAEQLAREAELRAEAERQAAETARLAAEAAAAKSAEEKHAAELAAQQLAEEHRVAEAARVAAEEARLAEEARIAEEARLAEIARREEAARLAEEQKSIAEAKAAATPPVEPLRTTLTPVAPDLEEVTAAPAAKPGLLGRLMGRAAPATVVRRTLDDDMLEQLEELLITADMGVDTALRVTANMAEGRFGKKLSVAEIKDLMATEVARIMEPVARPLPLYPKTPQVVLVVGVNGSGKTTTIGKLASQFKAAGKKVVIAAGDTFRAAAVEQLQVWGERAGVPVLTAAQGSDPASLAFDAMAQAEADGADLLLIDTAGRLQNRGDLMEELAKIVRVIRKKDETAPHNTLLVLDATTGQNALNQVKVFQEISDVSGLVMTKLDGTAKGGVLVALADKFGLPIHAIGVGEQIDDLQAFDPQEFADALVGYER